VEPRKQPPGTVVEVIGPAGAGKTSIVAALASGCPQVRVQGPYRQLRHVPAYGFALAGSGPMLVVAGLAWNPRVANRVVRVQASSRLLAAPSGERGSVVVVDQGPIYGLARLELDDVEWSGALGHWRERVLEHWSTHLRLLVVLDAPTEVLVDRVRTRAKGHAAKDRSDGELRELIGRYQGALRRLGEELVRRGSTPTCRLDTGATSVEAAAAQIREAIRAV
jgi:shikimate kinase